MSTAELAAILATSEAEAPDMSVTEPREVKLTIADLELLNREWRKTDAYHSTELIDGRVYYTPARYCPRGWATGQLLFRLQNALRQWAPSFSQDFGARSRCRRMTCRCPTSF